MTEWFDLNDADEKAIAAFMWRIANLRIPNPESPSTALGASRIPDPAQLWYKAKLLKQWDAERRAQRPLDIMQPIEIAGGLVAAGILLYLSFLS
jgi:hypothetical protein